MPKTSRTSPFSVSSQEDSLLRLRRMPDENQQQKTKKGKKNESLDNSPPRASFLSEKEPKQFMAQHNPISAMLHQPDEKFDSQSSSSSSDQEENSEENSETWSQDSNTSNESQDSGTSDESKDSNTFDDDVPPYFMAQSAEEAYSQTEPIVKVKMKVKKMKKKQLQRAQNPSITIFQSSLSNVIMQGH
ncbi:lisH domain-containing protein C1711.05-like [Cannabis sativa]|uniref:lisH domain-containing protein C1711.05-like n=1 Tax=Cannabis sativa TaxID=3483 RepID=UPI0029CA9A8C|nr:lisH domain-containing protein C1711.05-like [Cannabis sativa]